MSENHIASIDGEDKAICGGSIGLAFHFKTVDQAVLNASHGELRPCEGCTRIVLDLLRDSLFRHGKTDYYDENTKRGIYDK